MTALVPLFSPDCLLVAWLEPGRFIFHADTSYAAFIANGHCWAGHSGLWLGPIADGHLYDMDGRPVAWSPAAPVRSLGRPLRPANVVRAVRPVRPVRPVDPRPPFVAPIPPAGWSALSFNEWLVFSDPKPEEPDLSAEDSGAPPKEPPTESNNDAVK